MRAGLLTVSHEAPGAPEAAQARAAIYGLLARVFGSLPTPGMIKAMREERMRESLSIWGVPLGEDFLGGDAERLAAFLSQEYTRLFSGPGKHIAAYESVFHPEEGEAEPRFWGRATVAVAAFFEELGLEIPAGYPPDHLSLELEAMAVMAQAEAGRILAGDESGAGRFRAMQQRFCQEHLIRWVPAVCDEIERCSESSFYRGMAILTAGLVEMTCGDISGNLQEEEAFNENT